MQCLANTSFFLKSPLIKCALLKVFLYSFPDEECQVRDDLTVTMLPLHVTDEDSIMTQRHVS
jgi:hypothetical protein